MSNIWTLDEQKDVDWTNVEEGIPVAPPPKPDIETKLIDIAEAEKPKTYLPKEGDKKPFEERKEAGFSMAEPVNIYEPGFRSEVKDALIKYWKDKRAQKDRLDNLRAKLGFKREG